MRGYVYILTNPSFRDDWVKIGKSSRPVNLRSKELDNTAVPLPFEIYAVMETEKYEEAEKQIHHLIDIVNPDMRIRKGREFFNVTPEKALSIFRECARTLDDAEIKTYADQQDSEGGCEVKDRAQGVNTPTRPIARMSRLTFKSLGIPVGAELSFAENDAVKATVMNDANLVQLQDGTKASLSRAVVIVKRRLGTATSSESYQGGVYWLYKGQRLITIRNQKESN